LLAAASGTAARLVLASDGSLLHVLAMSISRHLSMSTVAALPSRAIGIIVSVRPGKAGAVTQGRPLAGTASDHAGMLWTGQGARNAE
jgi:hypothetical protein